MPFVAQPSEKCLACGRTVYATEKTVVDDKEQKKVYHKQCIRCKECNKVLSVGQYSTLDGVFYCIPHFKQLFKTKGNFDESFGKEKATAKFETAPVTTSPPTTFIPESRDETPTTQKKETSEETLAKFRKFREEGDSNKCVVCAKTVYLAEKLLVENKTEKFLFHKTCFKCCVCQLTLDLRNYGSVDDKIYCKNHLKEILGTSRGASNPSFNPKNFVPETKEEKSAEKGQTPDHIAAKFKGLGASGEKCKLCTKTVYATERLVVEELNKQSIFHKSCFRCKACNIQLDVHSFGSSAGIIYCKVHLKEFGKPEQSRDVGFISPLAKMDDNYVSGTREDGSSPRQDDDDERPAEQQSEEEEDRERQEYSREPEEAPQQDEEPSPEPTHESEEESVPQQAPEQRERTESISEEGGERDEERRKKREERERQRAEEDKRYQEEKDRKEKDREERRKQRELEERQEQEDRERRKQEREARRRQQEEEDRLEEERRAEERRKRLESLND